MCDENYTFQLRAYQDLGDRQFSCDLNVFKYTVNTAQYLADTDAEMESNA
jgi:hypothetical protein